jgi:hypothetical protein
MKRDYFLVLAQYSACVITGYFYFVNIATILGVAAGFGPLGLLLLFLSLLLAGVVSGLSLFLPRIGSGLAIGMVLPFMLSAIDSVINNIPASEPTLWLVPGCIVTFIATINLLVVRHSPWEGSTPVRIFIAILAALPAIPSLLLLLSIIFWMAGWKVQ